MGLFFKSSYDLIGKKIFLKRQYFQFKIPKYQWVRLNIWLKLSNYIK